MLIPMEILSPQTSRTDSGAGVRNTSRSGNERNSSSFEKVMENELNRHDQKMLRRNSNPTGETGSSTPADKVETVTVQKEDEEIDKNGETLAAGVMGTQTNEIVFILEGDKESVANPNARRQRGTTGRRSNNKSGAKTGNHGNRREFTAKHVFNRPGENRRNSKCSTRR